MPSTTVQPAGQVVADGLYTLDFIKANLGLGQSALRTARRRGLPVKYFGRVGMVCGEDLIRYVRETARDEK